MAKTTFTCNACGASHKKWAGKCEACGAWNTIVEEAGLSTGPAKKSLGAAKGRRVELSSLDSQDEPLQRMTSGIDEFDRVLGGGLVPASAILVGGDPGIGKSTLLLQVAAAFARRGVKSIYISGEEATSQIRMRAKRLGLSDAPVLLAAETNVEDILATLKANGLVEWEHIMDISSRLVVNKASMKTKHHRMSQLINDIKKAVEST